MAIKSLILSNDDGRVFIPKAPDDKTLVHLDFEPLDSLTTTTDSSVYRRQVTFVGSASLSNAQSINGSYSLYNPSVAPNSSGVVFNREPLGSSSFTVESWVYLTNRSIAQAIFDIRNSGSSYGGIRCYVNQSGVMILSPGTGSLITSSQTVPTSSWNHIAFSRDQTNSYLFLNGNLILTTSSYSGNNFKDSGSLTYVGYSGVLPNTTKITDGYIDRFKIYKDCLYTSSFIPDSSLFESDSYPFYVDDSNKNIGTNTVSASTLQINGISATGQALLNVNSNGVFNKFNNNTIGNSTLVWDGSSWQNNTAVISTRYTGSTGGQISGNIDSSISVLSVANVNSGTLGTNYGGTGVSLPSNSNAILEVSKSAGGVVSYSILTGSTGQVLTVENSRYLFKFPVSYPDVRFYTSSATPLGGQTTYTWTKPSGARFARIILQGAGGGGGGGGTGTTPYGGGGGASGGYTDITIDASSISSATVRVGIGGTGGTGGTTASSLAGGTGGTTSFTADSIVYNSTGGGGGIRGVLGNTMSTPGTGLTANGGSGSAPATNTTATPTVSMPSGGGKGQGSTASTSGGIITNAIWDKNYGYSIDSLGNQISVPITSGLSGLAYSFPIVYPTPGYGAGGGGGGATTVTGQHTSGSQGGNGYAIIISW